MFYALLGLAGIYVLIKFILPFIASAITFVFIVAAVAAVAGFFYLKKKLKKRSS
jgi:hypothetical protein